MLYEIMRHIRNFFPAEYRVGEFSIEDGAINLPFLLKGQYFLIEGSVFNDGVYQYPADGLQDERFEGCITALKPPKAFLELATEIEAYAKKNAPNGFQSESFGGYSYTRMTKDNGGIADWKTVYAERLNTWRKL